MRHQVIPGQYLVEPAPIAHGFPAPGRPVRGVQSQGEIVAGRARPRRGRPRHAGMEGTTCAPRAMARSSVFVSPGSPASPLSRAAGPERPPGPRQGRAALRSRPDEFLAAFIALRCYKPEVSSNVPGGHRAANTADRVNWTALQHGLPGDGALTPRSWQTGPNPPNPRRASLPSDAAHSMA